MTGCLPWEIQDQFETEINRTGEKIMRGSFYLLTLHKLKDYVNDFG